MFTQKQLSAFTSITTPFYFYDVDLFQKTLDQLTAYSKKYNFIVHYALKANTNSTLLTLVKNAGLGADCVSGNEVKRAIECGFNPDHIVFAGVGKSDPEIIYALQKNIFCFNSESLQELEVINNLAQQQGKTANIALRINPNVNANTHKYITTGLEENKFGINVWELDTVIELLKKLTNLKLIGLHFHIGSQITDLNAFKSLCVRINELQQWFSSHHIPIENINVGGGLGVNYHEPETHAIPDFENYFKLFKDFLTVQPGQKVHFELGRSLVAQCGSLISKVLYVKKGINTNFLILDAGMTELIRPALYQAYHKIENISRPLTENTKEDSRYDVVGPVCESSDCFGKAVSLPETERGDYMAIRTTGAYGEVMTSSYNLRDKALVVYSNEIA